MLSPPEAELAGSETGETEERGKKAGKKEEGGNQT